MNIKVSIILPTYNGKHKWLIEAIESVLNQSYKNLELIIINDASTNNIEDIILEYVKKDIRVKYYKNKTNLQLTKTLNKGIKLSNGKYIARIDEDDIWCDIDKLKKQVNFMENNLDYGLCGTGVIMINEEGVELKRVLLRGGDKTIRNYILGSNQFVHSSVIIRKSIISKAGYYTDENYCYYTEDYDLWLRVGIHSKLHNLQEYCLKYRFRKGSMSSNKSFIQIKNAFKVYLKYKKYYPNKIKGFIKHIITIIIPKKIILKINEIKNLIISS